MIELYYWPTPNGHKVSILLEELGIDYRVTPVNIGAGDQFKPDFLAISPNNRMPAIIDHAPADGGDPVSLFESGAILHYLAEKHDAFRGETLRERAAVMQWLMWQMGGLGPMFGQDGHFKLYAPERIAYATDRYDRECRRLLGVLDGQLARTGDCVAGSYSIADMAMLPWIATTGARDIERRDYPHVQRWFETLRARPGVERGMNLLSELRSTAAIDDARAREVLFGLKPPSTT